MCRLVVAGVALACAGCGVGAAGSVVFEASGTQALDDGFSSNQVVDGYAVEFERYLVSFGGLTLAHPDGETIEGGPVIVDLTEDDATLLESDAVPAGRLDVSFTLEPATDASTLAPGTDDDLAQRMRDEGLTQLLEGRFRKGPEAIPFSFGVSFAVQASACTNGNDGTAGVIVEPGSLTQGEVSFHVDHMLYDKLGTHQGVQLRAEALVAAAGEDGVVTFNDLEDQDLLNLVGVDGQPLDDDDGLVVYEPGSSGATTLAEFFRIALTEQAHLNGGGLCTITALN